MDSGNTVFDDIIRSVDRNGWHEISFKVLEDNIENLGDNSRRPAREHILIWAVENGIHYEYKGEGSNEIVRFYRKN